MDAFYASVELINYPELRGLPVVIGGRNAHMPQVLEDGTRVYSRLRDYVGRGVLTTSTYEARALGVFSGMGTMKAAKLAPDAIILPVNFEAYRHYSRLFKAAVMTIAPCMEDRGIDEIYVDLTDVSGESRELAQRIRESVFNATGLRCSIGIAPNKLLAKIGSDLEKPDGLTLLSMDDVATRIWPLHVRKINGIGPKATKKLEELGVTTIQQLAMTPGEILQAHFGLNHAKWLLQASHGIDPRQLVTSAEAKSLSRETTFEQDLHARMDRAVLTPAFTALCSRLAQDLERKKMVCRSVGIKLRYGDFQTITRDMTLAVPTADPQVIRDAAGACLKRVPLQKKIRLLGVKVSALQRADAPPACTMAMPQDLQDNASSATAKNRLGTRGSVQQMELDLSSPL